MMYLAILATSVKGGGSLFKDNSDSTVTSLMKASILKNLYVPLLVPPGMDATMWLQARMSKALVMHLAITIFAILEALDNCGEEILTR